MIEPDFRGPNKRPQACASPLAIGDVLDAVAYAKRVAKVDGTRVYLVGISGGGHMALMMAAKSPKSWAAVSAWVPLTDLAAWHTQTKKAGRKYWQDVEKVCGGAPGKSKAVDDEYRRRSPLFILDKAAGLPIDINTGIHDGHTGSIPVSHSLLAFNVLAKANKKSELQVRESLINYMVKHQKVPESLKDERVTEEGRKHPLLFRRVAGPSRITVFKGGHDGDGTTAVKWLSGFRRK